MAVMVSLQCSSYEVCLLHGSVRERWLYGAVCRPQGKAGPKPFVQHGIAIQYKVSLLLSVFVLFCFMVVEGG